MATETEISAIGKQVIEGSVITLVNNFDDNEGNGVVQGEGSEVVKTVNGLDFAEGEGLSKLKSFSEDSNLYLNGMGEGNIVGQGDVYGYILNENGDLIYYEDLGYGSNFIDDESIDFDDDSFSNLITTYENKMVGTFSAAGSGNVQLQTRLAYPILGQRYQAIMKTDNHTGAGTKTLTAIYATDVDLTGSEGQIVANGFFNTAQFQFGLSMATAAGTMDIPYVIWRKVIRSGNELLNGDFVQEDLNWKSEDGGNTEEFDFDNDSCSIIYGTGGSVDQAAIRSWQKEFHKGQKYRVSFNVNTFSMNTADVWEMAWGEATGAITKSGAGKILIEATGYYEEIVEVPSAFTDYGYLCLQATNAGTDAGTIEVTDISVERYVENMIEIISDDFTDEDLWSSNITSGDVELFWNEDDTVGLRMLSDGVAGVDLTYVSELLQVGATYQVEFDFCYSTPAGPTVLNKIGGTSGTSRSTDGVYIEDVVCGAGSQLVLTCAFSAVEELRINRIRIYKK
jgi:hypothetical protein